MRWVVFLVCYLLFVGLFSLFVFGFSVDFAFGFGGFCIVFIC